MPSSDYTSAVGGGLKLKGSSGGIDKKKKKKKSSSSKPSTPNDDAPTSNLQKALAEDDDKVEVVKDSEVKEYGKTEAQRRHEERRKKRVSPSHILPFTHIICEHRNADRNCSSKNVSSAKESKRTRSAYKNSINISRLFPNTTTCLESDQAKTTSGARLCKSCACV